MTLVRWLRNDPVDAGMNAVPWLSQASNRVLSLTENGQIRWYAASFALGALAILSVMLLV